MEYSLKEIELEKEEFKKYIIVLKKFITWGSFNFLEKYKKIIHVITSIIAKYHNYDDWFFKTFLVYCLNEKKFIYYLHFNEKDTNIGVLYFKSKFTNIIHILRKCYTSEILEFIVETYGKILMKAKNKTDWCYKNNFFNDNFFDFVYEFVLQIQNNMKIPNKINLYDTIPEQLLYMIVNKYKLRIPIYLKKDGYYYN